MRLSTTINGEPRELDCAPNATLLEVLRESGFTSAKQGCDCEGTCGACTVLLDGEPILSCIAPALKAQGRKVSTVEALGDPSRPHALQRAFVEAGAVQCGFCTPGMLLAAKALLDRKPSPTDEDIAEALSGNLCRCTGYVKIVEAVKNAAAARKGPEVRSMSGAPELEQGIKRCESTPAAGVRGGSPDRAKAGLAGPERTENTFATLHRAPSPDDLAVVGKSVPKLDAMGMACGLARYVADHDLRGALVGHIVPSPYAHARIRRIDASKARAMKGVHAVLTFQDLPRNLHTTAGQGYVEPSPYDCLILDDKVRFVGDRVALVAAETRAIAEAAGRALEIDWEVLPAVLDPERAMESGAPVIHDEPGAHMPIAATYDPSRNLAAEASMGAGDVNGDLAASALVLRQTYRTHYAQHCPLEPHVCLGALDAQDRIVLVSSTQVPFHARRITAQALGLPVRRIRVIKPRIGGGFGAKQEVLLEQVAAALVLATRRKVLVQLTRAEEFLSRTRHPIRTSLTGGFNADGTLNALRMEVLSNTGAYGGHALTVMCNCGSKVLPLYRMKSVAFEGKAVYTNLPVGGAYRGYGATQAAFAMEVYLDEVAERLHLDPLELRRRNHILPGEGSPAFAALGEGKPGVEQRIGSSGLARCLEIGAREIGWAQKRGRPGEGPIKRGVGMCALMQGSSIPEIDLASVSLKLNDDGSFNLNAGATDLGTGSDTVLAQIAAEVLGVSAEEIVVTSSDTDLTPFDSGAYASSTTYLSGEAARRAALEVARQIQEVAADLLSEAGKGEPRLDPARLVLCGGRVQAPGGASVALGKVALRSLYERDQRQIASTASAVSKKSPPPFSAHFAEVEVDTETGKVRVVSYVAAVDCGTAINPRLAEGQIEGAVVNGISFALTEEFLFDDAGRLRNAGFSDYKLVGVPDMPALKILLVPTYEETGPYGAKSVSEIGINGPCPAIANAIFDAVGVRLRETPFTPERVLRTIRAKSREG